MQQIEFTGEEREDLISISATGVAKIKIHGQNLLTIYESLNRASVRFVAALSNEEPDERGVFVTASR